MIYRENIQDVALITFYQKNIYFFVCFVLRAAPHKVTTDFTLTLKRPLAVHGRDSLRSAQIWLFDLQFKEKKAVSPTLLFICICMYWSNIIVLKS